MFLIRSRGFGKVQNLPVATASRGLERPRRGDSARGDQTDQQQRGDDLDDQPHVTQLPFSCSRSDAVRHHFERKTRLYSGQEPGLTLA